MTFSRRDFVKTSVLSAVATGVGARAQAEDSKQAAQEHAAQESRRPCKRPIIICANNGFNYLDDAFAFLKSGGDTLDAALRVVKGPEDDPNDTSVGLGGIPNEEGVVELDACCMHGPTRRAGSVGGVRNIKNVSLVSKAVMEQPATSCWWAKAPSASPWLWDFPARTCSPSTPAKCGCCGKSIHSNEDWWGPGLADPHWQAPDSSPGKPQSKLWLERIRNLEARAADLGIAPELQLEAVHKVLFPATGTIHCSALNEKGEISGCTTTSGLDFKLPGRVGDSPIIGAGCYTDQDVGSAGATGSGEENIKVAGAHTIVENMRHGMSPQEAGMEALKRIVHNLQQRHEQAALCRHDVLHPAQRRRLCRGVAVGGVPKPASRTRSPCTTAPAAAR